MKRVLSFFVVLILTQNAFAQVKAHTIHLQDEKSASFVILPDVQNYVKYDYNQPILELMTAWCVDNLKNLNIQGVMCTGDLVDQNECLVPPFPRFGNLPSIEQWEFVSHAFARMDNKVPYIIATGNHDYGYTRSEVPITRFPEFFTISRNLKIKEHLVAVCNNRLGMPTLENAAFEFDMSSCGWGRMLVVAIEFAARDEVLEWVKDLVASDTYKDHTVILITHSYLACGENAPRLGKDHYKMVPLNGGEDMWERLVKPSKNIRLVISGHYAVPDEKMTSATGFRRDKNDFGKEVYQMMFNTQAIGGGMSGNGGDGWLRILEFMPDGKTVSARTYSPFFAFSPRTKDLAEDVSPCCKFTFEIE